MEYEIVQISNANNPTSNGFLDRLLWRQVCYNEHRVHDHDLYHQLNAINLYAILPLGLFGFLFNVLAIVSSIKFSIPMHICSYKLNLILVFYLQVTKNNIRGVGVFKNTPSSRFLPNRHFSVGNFCSAIL